MGSYAAYQSDRDVFWVLSLWCPTVGSIMAFLVAVEALNVLQPFLVFGLRFRL